MFARVPRPTVDELFELLKRTSLPTVLVEGKDDIIFYRKVEEDLQDYGVDMLPAGNKDAVLDLRKRFLEHPVPCAMIFVVDNDLWVHLPKDQDIAPVDVITTYGYSIENDLFIDGDLEGLLDVREVARFKFELERFSRWYALAISRKLSGIDTPFRTHPGKILDDKPFFDEQMVLAEGESYPTKLFDEITAGYSKLIRGKSLFALLQRQLSAKNRVVKFGSKQLMAVGAAKRGRNYMAIRNRIQITLEGG